VSNLFLSANLIRCVVKLHSPKCFVVIRTNTGDTSITTSNVQIWILTRFLQQPIYFGLPIDSLEHLILSYNKVKHLNRGKFEKSGSKFFQLSNCMDIFSNNVPLPVIKVLTSPVSHVTGHNIPKCSSLISEPKLN